MKHATSKALHAYWTNCQGRAGTAANALSPLLAPLLPSVFLLDLSSPKATISCCGQAIGTRYGRDLTGESFLSLWQAEDRRDMSRDLRALTRHASGLVAGVLGETVGSGFVAFEMLLLPLYGQNGVSGAIGSMARVGGHEETNRVRARLLSQSLRSVRFLSPLANGQATSPAGDTAAVCSLPAAPRRYGHLTLVSGGLAGREFKNNAYTNLTSIT